MNPFTKKKRISLFGEALEDEPTGQINASKMAALLKGDPKVTVIANYERDCVKNSAAAVAKVSELLAHKRMKKGHTQPVGTTLARLEESLSELSENCPFRLIPTEVLLRIVKQLPMTSILSLATTCKTFNGIINEQRHGIKDVNRISINFHEFRDNRLIVASVKRSIKDHVSRVERYGYCSRVEVDNELDETMFKLRCSPEGVTWVANILPALLTNSHVAVVDFVGDHGVRFEHALSFLNLTIRRAPFHIDKLSFALSTKNISNIHHCKFWIQLLQPRTLSIYSLSGGVNLQASDYYWLFTQQIDRVVLHNTLNLSLVVLSEVIKEWYSGRRRFLSSLELTCSANAKILFEIDELLKKIKYKWPNEGRLVIQDYWSVENGL